MQAKPTRRPAALTPIALAVMLAAAAPSPAAQRYWTFIGGCSQADWFGMVQGSNAEGKGTCWSDQLGGGSGAKVPGLVDDVFIQADNASQPLLVSFAAPVRGNGISGQANNVTLRGSSSFAAGLQVDRGSLSTNTLNLGVQAGTLLGQVNQTAGSVSALVGLTVFSGDYNLSGGSLFASQLDLRGQGAGARFTMTGGSLTAGSVTVSSELGGAASFSQLAGKVSSTALSIGNAPGTFAAAVDIKSAGTQWITSGSTTVGAVGSGALNILDGAQATSGTALIGAVAGASGKVTVQGSQSQWKMDSTLVVGNGGGAELLIAQGGRVGAANLTLDSAPTGSQGVLVQGAGSKLEVGTALRIGSTYDGTLTITDGGVVSDQFGVVGDTKRTNGSVTLSGAGSRWSNSTSLVIGDQARGSIAVSGGARLDSALATVGLSNLTDLAGSTVTLDDAQTLWSIDGVLTVGQGGSGSVTARGGATINSSTGVIGYAVKGSGTVTLNGGSWSNHGLVTVAQGGTGTLELKRGGSFASGALLVADGAGSVGALTMQDDGSLVDLGGSLTVGRSGAGTFAISDGARLNSGSASFGELAGSTATGTVGARSLWSNRGDLVVGGAGKATLSFSGSGISAQTQTLTLGRDTGGEGRLDLGGSSLTVNGDAVIGANGSGTVTVGAGGKLSSANGQLGTGSGGVGLVTLAASRGSDALWQLSGALQVGGPGKGSVELKAGGSVVAVGATRVGAGGRLSLAGGKLQTASLAIDRNGTLDWNAGTLKITGADGIALGGGGLAAQTELRAGRSLEVDNTLLVGGNTRLELNGGQLRAGRLALDGGLVTGNANARLDMNGIGLLSGRGTVDASVTGGVGKQISASGALNLGRANANDGFAYRGALDVGSQTVTLADSDGAELGSLTTLAAGGRLVGSNGLLLSLGEQLQSSGNAVVQGRFVNGGTVASAGGLLDFQGAVSGNGGFSGNVGFEAGFNPGNGTGNVGFGGGNVSFGSASMLTLEIDGTSPGRYDRLSGIGSLSFLGGLTLAFGPDFSTNRPVRLTLLDFGSFSGAFDPQRISITGIDPSRVDTSRLASSGQIGIAAGMVAVSAVPEPGTWALWIAGLGVMLARRRRSQA